MDEIKKREQRLLLTLCRHKILPEQQSELEKWVVEPLDWNMIFLHAMWHKVLFLVYENLKDLLLIDKAITKGTLPLLLINHWKQLYSVNAERNRLYVKHISDLIERTQQAKVDLVISKGGLALFERGYTHTNRKMYDIDLIGKREQLKEIEEVFSEAGFFHATYSYDKERYQPFDPDEKRKWLLYTRGLPNFLKAVDTLAMDHLIVQIQFRIGTTQEKTLDTKELIDCARVDRGFPMVSDEDLLLQLVLHLYRETTERSFNEWNMDWNLIKFCDLDRFTHYLTREKLETFLERIHKLQFEKECIYSFHYLNQVFPSPLYTWLIKYVVDGNEELVDYLSNLGDQEATFSKIWNVGSYMKKPESKWSKLMGAKTT